MALTDAQLATLQEDILEGPLAEDCAPHVASGRDVAVADLFNDKARGGTATGRLSKAEFTLAILPAVVALATKDAATQAKWDRLLDFARALESIDPALPQVGGMFDLAVADGLISPEQRAAIGVRPVSRAEALFGIGFSLHHLDVAASFGRK